MTLHCFALPSFVSSASQVKEADRPGTSGARLGSKCLDNLAAALKDHDVLVRLPQEHLEIRGERLHLRSAVTAL